MINRLCVKCQVKHAAYGFRPYCRTCAPNKIPSRHTVTHRVQAVEQFKTVSAIQQREVPQMRELVIDGVTYLVVADGTGAWISEPQQTPKQFGCSLLDASRVVR